MPIEVKMPRMSLTMEIGSIVHWLKAPGDRVERGEDLAEIETDKVNVALEAPASGYVRALLVEPGVDVACDSPIALLTATADEPLNPVPQGLRLRGDGRATPTPVGSTAHNAPDSVLDIPVQPISTADENGIQPTDTRQLVPGVASAIRPQSEVTARAHVNASPAAKNLAKQAGVDLALVAGTGPGGRIGLEDVQRAVDARATSALGRPEIQSRGENRSGAAPSAVGSAPAIAPRSEARPLSRMRAAIAQRMTAALAAPQFTVRRRVDMAAALRVRQAQSAAGGRAPGVIDLIHLAVARALLAHPEVNASLHAGRSPEQSAIVAHTGVDLGFALALPDGLIAPVIRDAHTMGLQALAAERLRLQEDASAGRLAASALGDATFTVSNLGTLHVDEFTAIVTPPEVAILAVGQLQETPVARDGAIHVVPLIALTVTADHRALDGAQVAYFLETLAANLNHLETLL